IAMLVSAVILGACNNNPSEQNNTPVTYSHHIPPGGNSWVVSKELSSGLTIDDQGITQWEESATKTNTYVKLKAAGELQVGLNAKVSTGNSTIAVTVNGQTKEVTISTTDFAVVNVGSF